MFLDREPLPEVLHAETRAVRRVLADVLLDLRVAGDGEAAERAPNLRHEIFFRLDHERPAPDLPAPVVLARSDRLRDHAEAFRRADD